MRKRTRSSDAQMSLPLTPATLSLPHASTALSSFSAPAATGSSMRKNTPIRKLKNGGSELVVGGNTEGRNPNCASCGLCEDAETVCLYGAGPASTPIMVIGEAPGAMEDDEGKPFIGKAGQELFETLAKVGIKRSHCYVTNAVKCRPEDNRTPKAREIKACSQYLRREFSDVSPRFVLLLGNVPLIATLGIKGIQKLRGKPIERDGIIYFPTFHPAYLFRYPEERPTFEVDLRNFANIVAGGEIPKESGTNVQIVDDERSLRRALADISRSKWIEYDLETSGLNPWAPGSWVTSIGVGTRRAQWCFPLEHPDGWLYGKPEKQRRVARRIARAGIQARKAGHNAKFDSLWLRVHFGVRWYADFDTLLAHYNLDENSYHGLDILATRFFGAPNYDVPLEIKHGKTGTVVEHCDYLALDLYYTRKLRLLFTRMLADDPATDRLFRLLTMRMSRLYTDAEYNGVYVDQSRLEDAHAYWVERRDKALAKLNARLPSSWSWKDKKTKQIRPGINWGSPTQVANVLFNYLGLKSLEKTKGGKDAVNESVLLRIAEKHEVARDVLDYREADKQVGTFITSWKERSYDSFMHPTFKIWGTVTGRPSCEEPNLQQTPRDPRIRSLITAPPGWTLVSMDYSQAELRFTAHDANEPTMKLVFQTGGDIHVTTCQNILGILEPNKDERKKAKAVNFGFIYGMWWKKFILYARDNYGLKIKPTEAKKTRRNYFNTYAGLDAWHTRKKRFVRRNGYVRNLLGRRRRLPDALLNDDSPAARQAERQAINSPIQSVASDFNSGAACEMNETFHRSYYRPCGTVHDNILALVRNDMLNEVVRRGKAIMEKPKLMKMFGVSLSVPLVADVEIGPWGAGRKWQGEHIPTDDAAIAAYIAEAA